MPRRRPHRYPEDAVGCGHNGEHGGIEMFELAATPQRTFKGQTLLVDRDGIEIDVRVIVLGVDLLAMHVGNRNDIDQCCNGAAVASEAQRPHASCTGS